MLPHPLGSLLESFVSEAFQPQLGLSYFLVAGLPILSFMLAGKRKEWVASVVFFGVINPASITILIWLLLILSKRNRLNLRRQGFVQTEQGLEQDMLQMERLSKH